MKTELNKSVRISKILLVSIITAISVTAITGFALGLIFKPYRYTGKASEIQTELSSSNEYQAPFYLYDSAIIYFDVNGVKVSDSVQRSMQYRDFEAGVKIAKKKWSDRQLIFGGINEFFKYCDNAGEQVNWNIGNIEESIQGRQKYLVTRIKVILLIVFPVIFVISYLALYFKKHKIKIIVN